MKKTMLIASLLICITTSFSQKATVQGSDSVVKEPAVTLPNERIGKLEAEMASLKTKQLEIQKQLSEIQSSLNTFPKKKKPVVNRIGSKQVNWSTNGE